MRAARLRRSREIANVRSGGRSLRRAAFAARVLRTELSGPRIAVTATRSLGRAVQRNRARRRVREAFRVALADHRDIGGVDVVVSVRPASSASDFRVLVTEAATLLREAAQ
ncbi:MAG: ribonuclease P protein component [Chloroflexota bacterium]